MHTTRSTSETVFTFLAATTAFCSATATPAHAIVRRDDVDDSQYQELASQSQFAPVGQMFMRDGGGNIVATCSATVIAPNWVLTAAHCVDEFSSFDFTVGGITYTTTTKFIAPGWVPGDFAGGNDIAVLRFGDGITGARPAPLFSGIDERGFVGASVGFGRRGNGSAGNVQDFDLIKRAAQNNIDAFGDQFLFEGDSEPQFSNRILFSDFDSPVNSAANNTLGNLGSTAVQPFTSSETPLALEGSIAAGDNGGGTFVFNNGTWELAAVHSFGVSFAPPFGDGLLNASYSDVFGSTRISSHRAFIASVSGVGAVTVPEVGTVSLLSLGAFGTLGVLHRRRSRG